MNQETIRNVIEQFVEAARNAIQAGFDGIEIHGKKDSKIFNTKTLKIYFRR
jgi:2,4-dienoyl-CoA reductase-like NADH-dependent reductase (Old Yellow Enzyme family)